MITKGFFFHFYNRTQQKLGNAICAHKSAEITFRVELNMNRMSTAKVRSVFVSSNVPSILRINKA